MSNRKVLSVNQCKDRDVRVFFDYLVDYYY